jgi:tetratricopeptide (TPR) repeat protein
MYVNKAANHNPQVFQFWDFPKDRMIGVGPEQRPVVIPSVPIPIEIEETEKNDPPTDDAIGKGLYNYLRQFPNCEYNKEYANLLKNAFPHYLVDLASQVVMLDKKDVESSYLFRKLTYLKILNLVEPDNLGLLGKLSQGFYDLGLTFTELSNSRQYLLESMRYALSLVKIDVENTQGLSLLAEIDILFGDYPSAVRRLKTLVRTIKEKYHKQMVQRRLKSCLDRGMPDHCLVDDLEMIGDAIELYSSNNFALATELLERLEQNEYFCDELLSADFLCLLGLCRIKTGDHAGAFDALSRALELDPEHSLAQESLDAI